MKLGILDWGIGGVGLLKKIRSKSDIDIIYYSDTGFTPYGKVPKEELTQRVQKVIDYLRLYDCEYIAVACNAASTVLNPAENIFGVIRPAVNCVKSLNINSVGIAGGKRTIDSNLYKDLLEKEGIKVTQQIAQPLSARIESGDLHSKELRKEIETIFEPLKKEKHILLACTHYPAISKQINTFLPNTILIDPIETMAHEIIQNSLGVSGNNSVKWVTSGNIHEMSKVLKTVYNMDVNSIERNRL